MYVDYHTQREVYIKVRSAQSGGGGGEGGDGGALGRQKKKSCSTNVAHGVASKNISTLA